MRRLRPLSLAADPIWACEWVSKQNDEAMDFRTIVVVARQQAGEEHGESVVAMHEDAAAWIQWLRSTEVVLG